MDRPEWMLDAPTEALIAQAHAQRRAEFAELVQRLRDLGVRVRLPEQAAPVVLEGVLLDGAPFHLRAEGDAVALYIWSSRHTPRGDEVVLDDGEVIVALDLASADATYRLAHDDAGHIRAGDLQTAFSRLLAQHRAATQGMAA